MHFGMVGQLFGVGIASLAIVDCDAMDIHRTFTVLRVSDSHTGEPLEGVLVAIEADGMLVDSELATVEFCLRPTDASGLTWVPVQTLASEVQNIVFNVTVQQDDKSEVIHLGNRLGASTLGNVFGIEVLDVFGDAPESLPLDANFTDGEIVLKVDAIVRAVGVFDCNGTTNWFIVANEWPSYIDEVVIGEAPPKFRETVDFEGIEGEPGSGLVDDCSSCLVGETAIVISVDTATVNDEAVSAVICLAGAG